MRYPVVLLDVGETLIGPSESFGTIYSDVFATLGIDLPGDRFERCIREVVAETEARIPTGVDRYSYYAGGEQEYWLRFSRSTLEKATGEPVTDELTRRALELLRAAFRNPAAWRVYPDVVPAMEALRDDGVRMGVVSNWDSRLPAILEMLGLGDYFEALGVSHLEGLEKPDPGLFLCVLRKMGARPEEALHVGDIPAVDYGGARAAGVDCLLVDRRGKIDASFEPLPDLTELPRIAREGLRD